MGADGNILIINTDKAIEKFGIDKWILIKESSPTCVYDRNINGLNITTFYHGDNMVDNFYYPEDWGSWCEKDERKKRELLAKEFIDSISEISIDTWEVWT